MFNQNEPKHRQEPLKEQFNTCVIPRAVRWARDFCLETSMHGFLHIAVQGRHWFERILWATITAAAIWGAIEISLGQWQRFNDNPTVVTLEKDFRNWRFSLPSITACDVNRVKASKLPEVIKKLWNIEPEHEKYDYYKRFVTTVANSDIFHLKDYKEFKDDHTLDVDLKQLVIDVLPDFLVKTTWSQPTDAVWTPVMTEAGICYNLNSLAIDDVAIETPNPNDTKSYPRTCKYSSQSCYLVLEVQVNCDMYFHSPYDVLDLSTPASRVVLTLNRFSALSVMETGSGRGVKDLSPRRRSCLYTDEPVQEHRKVYSANTCRLACRSRLAIKLCGCKPFYYFYDEGPTCTPAGMACLAEHASTLSNNAGVRCVCTQQCRDAQFRVMSSEDQYWDKGPFVNRGSARYTIQAPRTRYTREIVFHFQDLVVSFGGAAGLFLGASFISFVEMFYFLLSKFLGLCVRDEPKNNKVQIKAKRAVIPYETWRKMEMSSIRNKFKNYDYNAQGQRKFYH